jgi:tRNA 2-thiouridine synthesizing protein A
MRHLLADDARAGQAAADNIVKAYGRMFALDAVRPGPSIAPMSETTLDLRGLRCPLPALKTRKALTRLAAGDRLVVECTDPLAAIDIPHLITQTGDVLEDSSNQPGLFVFRIKKA